MYGNGYYATAGAQQGSSGYYSSTLTSWSSFSTGLTSGYHFGISYSADVGWLACGYNGGVSVGSKTSPTS